MTDTQDQPLWRVLGQVFYEDVGTIRFGDSVEDYCGNPDNATWAAQIRALADWLVPEQPEPEMQTLPPTVDYGTAWALWHQRDDLRQRLLAEADRAARGER